MRATGIIRRIDDLGRIVIPKEIRRNLRIREGDPLELYVEQDGVCFRKYKRFDTNNWYAAEQIVSQIINNFSILDVYGDVVKNRGINIESVEEAQSRNDVSVFTIANNGDILAYLVVRSDCDVEKTAIARNVLKSFLEYADADV